MLLQYSKEYIHVAQVLICFYFLPEIKNKRHQTTTNMTQDSSLGPFLRLNETDGIQRGKPTKSCRINLRRKRKKTGVLTRKRVLSQDVTNSVFGAMVLGEITNTFRCSVLDILFMKDAWDGLDRLDIYLHG